ncbi:hypothetical protein GOP47_0022005 [Adiantum capillus-veneris]|uniref:Uncharacterized protein n=1 Tax=Adiantum capillus-veneris TaxID=13818 RepID=A0A9D4Z5R6_ADICA|nr:hypothetical protein GOP47_0022005 [Adiantum capillus-veneris]
MCNRALEFGEERSKPSFVACWKAKGVGFFEEFDTLGDVLETISKSDLVVLLISEATQPKAMLDYLMVLCSGIFI